MYNKEELINAIWSNPTPCTGMQWQRKGNTWQSRQRLDATETARHDKSILRLHNGQIFVNYNGGSFPQGQDIWQFLQWRYSTNDFIEVLQIVGNLYGVEPDLSQYTEEQRKRAQQRSNARRVAQEIATAILNAGKMQAGATAAAYLNGRGLQCSNRMGAISSTIAEDITNRLCSTFADIDKREAQRIMRQYFPTLRKDYSTDKQGAWVNFIDYYQLAAPYYNGSNIAGFWLRLTAEQAPTYMDEAGAMQSLPKYIYSKDMAKGGYCTNLRSNEPVYLVEGMLDAEAMQQAGYTNVMALGGQAPTNNKEDEARSTIATLQRYGIKQVVYVPDYEYTKEGTLATAATQRTITALLPYMDSIHIVNLETEAARTNRTKVDIADYLQQYGEEGAAWVFTDAEAWYYYRMRTAVRECGSNMEELAEQVRAIYDSITNPIIRQRIKQEIEAEKYGYMRRLKEAGVNAAALSMIDRQGKQTSLPHDMATIGAELQQSHTAEDYAKILNKAARIQHVDTFATFAAQANATQEQLHGAVCNKPEYLETSWQLWATNPRTQLQYSNRKISFAPAAVSLMCAPTNHGKTLVLLQTALNFAKSTHKRYLYLSTENDAEQLYIRALSAYIGKDWAADEENPRSAIRQFIKAQDIPQELFNSKGQHLNMYDYIRRYNNEIMPHLALVRTPTDIDALYTNCMAVVEDWQNAGIEVGAIFVDYLQQLHAYGKSYSRTDELKAVCDKLNDLSKAIGIPVICAAQFNREATKANTNKLDDIELANIGESAGIENIAEDCYLIWQVDKIKTTDYMQGDNFKIPANRYRSRRCFTDAEDSTTLRNGYLYIENLKARDYATGGYCFLPFNGAAGCITSNDSEK